MKKSLLLLIPSLFLVASCGKDPSGPSEPTRTVCNPGPCIDNNDDGVCDNCGFPVETGESVKVKAEPNYQFYLKVNEDKILTNKLDNVSKLKPEQLTFTWNNKNTYNATLKVNETDSRKATLTGKKPGKVEIVSTNDWAPALVAKYHANVIDFDAENMYLWEYKSEDKSQFGYTSENKAGIKSGTAVLGNVSWEFTRSKAVSLNTTKAGRLGFGRGEEPETSVELKTSNKRSIKKIVVEASSANGLAKMSINVGDQEVCKNLATPSSNDDMPKAITIDNIPEYKGDISIKFDTPEYDPSRADDPTYDKPGAIYLKSIWITYGEESFDFVTEKTYDFASLYADQESDFYKNLPGSTSAKAMIYEDDDFVISFAKVSKSKSDEALKDYAKTNSDIEVKIKKTSEVIKQVSFTYQSASTPNQYNIRSSVLGGQPYDTLVAGGDNSGVYSTIYTENVNAINLVPNKTNYVGLKSLTIKTVAGEHAVIDSVSFADGAKPIKTTYQDGELFEPEGLGVATVKFTNSEIPDVTIGAGSFVYYDGPSYDNPSDHSAKKLELSGGTTFVVGIYQNHEIRVEGLTVNVSHKTLNRITAPEDLTTGEYLFVIPSSASYWKGSMKNADMKKGDSIGTLGEIEFNDTISVSSTLLKEFISITNESGVITITNKSGGKIGMTASGAFSIAASPEYTEWSVSVTDKFVDFVVTGGDYTKYLGFTGVKFDLKDSATSNIALYKVAE